jgi:hypothetical protein
MATRSRIGIINEDGTVTSVYCHWDGYPSHHGRILRDHYDTDTSIRELLSFGDLSSLDIKISPSGDTHSFKDPEEGCCVFYGRDRGEEGSEATLHKNVDEFLSDAEMCDYAYLFEANEWFCARVFGSDRTFKRIHEVTEA